MSRIREADSLDREKIREVHQCAFPEGEGQIVAALAVSLLSEEAKPETYSLVAECDGQVVGHVAYSPVTVDGNEDWSGYILAPLGILPEYQNRRIGTKLIESGIQRLTEKGVITLFVYGDPQYYGKFGFTADAAANYLPPYDLQYPFGWQAIALNDSRTDSPATLSCVASLRDPRLW